MIKCSQGRSSAPRTCSGLHCLNFHPVTNNQSFIIIIVLNKIHFYYHIALYNSFSFTCLDIDIHSKLFLSFQGIRCSWQAHDRLRSLVTVKKRPSSRLFQHPFLKLWASKLPWLIQTLCDNLVNKSRFNIKMIKFLL